MFALITYGVLVLVLSKGPRASHQWLPAAVIVSSSIVNFLFAIFPEHATEFLAHIDDKRAIGLV